jgi:hypothetical protein
MRLALCALRIRLVSASITPIVSTLPAMLLGVVHARGGLTVEDHWEGSEFAGCGFSKSPVRERLLLKAQPRGGVVCLVICPRKSFLSGAAVRLRKLASFC